MVERFPDKKEAHGPIPWPPTIMVERQFSEKSIEETLNEFGQELGKITARLKKEGITQREVRYVQAFSQLKQRGLVEKILSTKPQPDDDFEGPFLIYAPATRKLCWMRLYNDGHEENTPIIREIRRGAHDGLDEDGILIYHVTMDGDFEMYGIPYGKTPDEIIKDRLSFVSEK